MVEFMEDSGMRNIGEYTTLCHNSVAQYIDKQPIFDIVMVEERCKGYPEIMRWW